jgi:RNA polymerase sigma-70 factor, ECF subfamily
MEATSMLRETERQDRVRAEYGRIALKVQPQLIHRALRLTGDRDQASDLVQATLERGYRAFARFEPGSNAAAWLSTIMTRHYIDELRRERPMRFAVNIDSLEIPAPTGDGAPAWARLEDDEVREVAAGLPDYCRRAFELYSFERLSYPQIAARLGLPLNTVCSRIHRARRLLRPLLLAKAAN